jgi:hypothetical protein
MLLSGRSGIILRYYDSATTAYREHAVRSSFRFAALGLAALAAACSNDAAGPTSTTSPASINTQVATLSAEAVGQDIELMHGPGGLFSLGFRWEPGSFGCSSGTFGGITVTRTCTYLDGDGITQDAYDTLTTASVTVHTEVSGSIGRADWGSSTVSAVSDMTASGLEGTETAITWNGSSNGTMSRIHMYGDSSQVQMDLVRSGTVTDVVIPVPRTSTGWPLGGTITWTVTLTITGGPHDGATYTRDVTVTFDGTQYATVTVNGETFTVDLARRVCTGGDHEGGGMHR